MLTRRVLPHIITRCHYSRDSERAKKNPFFVYKGCLKKVFVRSFPAGSLRKFRIRLGLYFVAEDGERSIDRPVLRHACLSRERWLKISHFHGNRYLLRRRRHSPDITETAAALRSHCTRTMSKEKY